MNENKLRVITQDEVDGYKKAIKDKGYSVEDFDDIEKVLSESKGGFYTPKGEITIERKSTGKKRVYKTGSGRSWPAKFEEELGNGCFD
ncbi:MAG: hypothetical protein V3V61_07340 [Gammaproteobacteria bacterium]